MAPVFDGHNDLLFRLWQKDPATAVLGFVDGEQGGQLDLPRMHDGGFAGGFFAVFVPSDGGGLAVNHQTLNPPPYKQVEYESADKTMREMLDLFHRLVVEVPGRGFRHCLTVADIKQARADGAIAAILHMEGAEAIGPDLSELDELHALGLRSIGPVWSRPNVFGEGVPFAWPSLPDTGAGLTAEGKDLIRACNTKRIMIDLSHMNLKGFWDVANISSAPLVATHSNCHALTPSARNLLDEQLRGIGESRGMVGLNYAIDFLQTDGSISTAIAPEVLIRHLEHMIKLAGEDCVGLGSDFDGAHIPDFIHDVSGLPRVVDAMREAGFGERLIAKITHENWVRLLQETWGA